MTYETVKRIFYNLVKDGNKGFTTNITKEGYSDIEYLGSDKLVDEEYDAEFSNGTAGYIPTLRVDDINEFLQLLYKVVLKYIEFNDLSKHFERFKEDNIIKNIILTILTNAR